MAAGDPGAGVGGDVAVDAGGGDVLWKMTPGMEVDLGDEGWSETTEWEAVATGIFRNRRWEQAFVGSGDGDG